MFAAVNPYPTRLLGPIITAVFAERINQRQRLNTGKVPTYWINQITTKITAVNFLDGIQLLDKVVEFHRAISMAETLGAVNFYLFATNMQLRLAINIAKPEMITATDTIR